MSINLGVADLEAVLAVRRHASFRAAAQELFITQPSVSSRIQHAEQILGVALFHRTTRKVVPTAHGERLCEYAERMLYDLKVLAANFKDESQLRAGKVIVGATPTLAATLAAEVIGAFRQRHPGIEVVLMDDFFGRSLDRLLTGEADFAVTPSLDIGPRLALEEIGREEVVVAAASDHPLVRRARCNLQATLGHALVMVSSQTALSQLVARAYAAEGLLMPQAAVTQHSLSAVALAINTGQFTFLPKRLLQVLRQEGLGTARVASAGLFRPLCLVTARERALQPAAEALMDEFRQHAKSATAKATRA
jgi:DNA-binding transcriptional LysR family regulator